MGTKPASLILIILLIVSLANADTESNAMADLARSLTNLPASWTSTRDHCKWDGIKCTGSQVTSIDLNRQSISGTLPASTFASLPALQTLNLAQNAISGPITSLSSLSSLQDLNLASNAFTSVPADFLSGLTALQTVSLDNNPLSPWPLPTSLADCSALVSFSASNTSLTGPVPDFFANLPALTSLQLSYNNLSGALPGSLSGSALQDVYLNNQKGQRLSGTIEIIGSMPQLKVLFLQSNAFTGPIPDLANLTSLEIFNVRDNQLTGIIPDSLTTSNTVGNVVLSNNFLQGPFPTFANKSAVLDVDNGNTFCLATPGACDDRVMTLLAVAGGFGFPLDIANSWKGNDPCKDSWIGVTCGASGNVQVLNFPSKKYAGTISPSIANLTGLTRIILSDNNLTGPIPGSLTELPNLQVLDVTNNNLDGKVPDFHSTVTLKLSGNPNLGSDSGSSSSGGGNSGSSSGGSPDSPTGISSGSKSSNGGLIAGITIAIIVLVLCFACLAYYQHRKKHAKKFGRVETQSPPNEQDMVKIGIGRMNMPSEAASELYSQSSVESSANAHLVETQGMLMSMLTLRKATGNFSESNILGRGGFGVVYKGELNGNLIAVKRNECDIMGKKGLEEFKAEIDVLRKVKHRHLVTLLGYCIDGSERLLVYEYMPEGTLGQHLFDLNESGYCAITWKQRLTVALDVARGIEYLHSLAQESFIHRDLKPSNILLDKDLRAKVSDFGLVKLADKEKSMMTRLAGTFGYLAPEYAITGKVSTKVDVYAFGVILMELISGRKVLDESLPDEETHLVSCFRRNILNKDRFIKSVDPTLALDEEAWNSLFEVAELARHCTGREPHQRPDMGHAVNVLGPLVEKWKPSQCEDEDNFGDSGTSLSQRLEKWQYNDSTSTMDLYSSRGGN